MIRVGYINQYDIYDETVDFINEQYMMAESAYSDYMTLVNRINEYAFIEGVSESDEQVMEEGAKEVVEKIGQAVINTVDKVIELIKKCIENITGLIFKHKDTGKELDKLLADHPELKNEVIIALQKGDMDLKSLKDVNELLDTSQDIINKMEAGKLEPSKAEELYNKAVNKLEKAKPFFDFAKGVGAVIAAGLAIKTLLPKMRDAKLDCEISKHKMEAMKHQKNIDKILNTGDGSKLEIDVTGIARMKNKIINSVCAITAKNVSGTNKAVMKVDSSFGRFLKRFLTGDNGKLNLSNERARAQKAKIKVDNYTKIRTGKFDQDFSS